MDILCVGMYRACSTWQYEVAAHLIERFPGGKRLGYVTGDFYAELRRQGDAPGAWRTLKSHEGNPAFRAALRGGNARALYAIRDVRDVVYSMLHKRKVDFETFLVQGMIHQLIANDREWTQAGRQPRLDQRYETIIADPATAVRQIAAFLGFPLSDYEASRIAEEYSFEANRKRIERTAENLRAAGVDLTDPANAIVHDEATLLHWNHMRQGRVGDWRDRAIPSERYVLACLANRWLTAHSYAPESVAASASCLAPGERRRLHWLMARGAWACWFRCRALYHPRAGRIAKKMLGLTERDVARPASAVPGPYPRSGGTSARHETADAERAA
jgi:hypothetical protein